MTRYQFKLSDIGEGIAEAELVEWLVNVGDIVREDQPVAAFMTDKATVELETPVSGTVVERTGEIGEAIRVGATILEIEIEGNGADAEKSEPFASSEVERRAEENVSRLRSTRAELLTPSPRPAPPPPAPPSSGKVLASPLVRRRAHDLGLDLASVPHSGPRVLNKDLEAFLVAPREEAAPTTTLIDAEVPVVGLRRAIANLPPPQRAAGPQPLLLSVGSSTFIPACTSIFFRLGLAASRARSLLRVSSSSSESWICFLRLAPSFARSWTARRVAVSVACDLMFESRRFFFCSFSIAVKNSA